MSTLVCVPIMVETIEAALADSARARDAGADLVEFRLDAFFAGSTAEIENERLASGPLRSLTSQSPLPCILTCRSANEGGEYAGDEDARLTLYETLGSAGTFAYIDLELAAYSRSADARLRISRALSPREETRSDIATGGRLILSAHDFQGRPHNLFTLLEKLRAEPAARLLKVAWRARSLRDNLEVFDILRERDRPTIALAMGEYGLISRVLAPKFGGFLTFASLRDSSTTAPGQPTLRELLDLYHFRSIRPSTRVFGIIGWPVGHSLSPILHNAGFEWLAGREADVGKTQAPDQEDPTAAGFSGVYLPMPIGPEWEHFKATLAALLDYEPLDFRGASVTIPHKEHLLRFAREETRRRWTIDPLALRVGAANTIVVEDDGSVRALNTDVAAVVEPLARALGRKAGDLSGVRVGVIGAGGVGRAAVFGLLDAGASVVVCNRSPVRAEQLVREAAAGLQPDRARTARIEDIRSIHADAWINTTPVGMAGGPDPLGLPFDPRLCTPTTHANGKTIIVFDLVYNPLDTPLLVAAKQCGLRAIPGIEMFIAQAAAQFQEWTKGWGSLPGASPTPPLRLFERIVRETLERQ